LVQAWAQEQEESSARSFSSQDVLVPWRLQKHFESSADSCSGEDEDGGALDAKGQRVFQRYCHVYREGELENLCERCDM